MLCLALLVLIARFALLFHLACSILQQGLHVVAALPRFLVLLSEIVAGFCSLCHVHENGHAVCGAIFGAFVCHRLFICQDFFAAAERCKYDILFHTAVAVLSSQAFQVSQFGAIHSIGSTNLEC